MKKSFCTVLVVTIMSLSGSAFTHEADAVAKPLAPAPTIRGAVEEAGAKVVLAADEKARAADAVRPTLPPRKSSRIRKQGGGSTGMIIGLVSTVVGVAAMVYMVRELKKDQDENKN